LDRFDCSSILDVLLQQQVMHTLEIFLGILSSSSSICWNVFGFLSFSIEASLELFELLLNNHFTKLYHHWFLRGIELTKIFRICFNRYFQIYKFLGFLIISEFIMVDDSFSSKNYDIFKMIEAFVGFISFMQWIFIEDL